MRGHDPQSVLNRRLPSKSDTNDEGAILSGEITHIRMLPTHEDGVKNLVFDCDVAVLGGGGGGWVAACRAAERGRRVVLVEKTRRPGVKILMSGGTRCNITNARGLRRLGGIS